MFSLLPGFSVAVPDMVAVTVGVSGTVTRRGDGPLLLVAVGMDGTDGSAVITRLDQHGAYAVLHGTVRFGPGTVPRPVPMGSDAVRYGTVQSRSGSRSSSRVPLRSSTLPELVLSVCWLRWMMTSGTVPLWTHDP